VKKKKNIISVLLSMVLLCTGVTPIFASPLEKNDIDLNQETLVELNTILNSVREQLIEQDAEDLIEMYEGIIIEKYNNLAKGYSVESDNIIATRGTAQTFGGSGSLYYTYYDDVEFFDIYLSQSQTQDYYNDLVYQSYGGGILELMLGIINDAFDFGYYRQHVLINPLHEIINGGSTRANILTSIDHTDLNRKTMIVVDWGSAHPYMTYPSWAKNLKAITPLHF
jgi:hypothetical protein